MKRCLDPSFDTRLSASVFLAGREAFSDSFSSMRRLLPFICALLLAAFGLSSCETPGQTALLGAGIGAVAGRHTLRNAAIGAGAGYLVGKIAQESRRGDDYDRYDDDDLYDGRPARRYAYARPTERRGFVISPYSGNVIDVRGIPRGERVIDPSVDRVFIIP